MKKIKVPTLFLIIIILCSSFCACADTDVPNPGKDNPSISITNIDITTKSCTMLVGETKYLEYTTTPANADESVLVTNQNSDIAKVVNNSIIACSPGTTTITVKPDKKNSTIYDSITVNVINPINKLDFESKHSINILHSIIKVYCERYNKNIFGSKKDVHIQSGYGVIINSQSSKKYFFTDKSIFDKSSTSYKYEDWYIKDYYGNKFSIPSLNYSEKTLIAIGSFSSSNTYYIPQIANSNLYIGDYAISNTSSFEYSRINKIVNVQILPNAIYPVRVFELNDSPQKTVGGIPVFNLNGELVGIYMKYNVLSHPILSGQEIKQAYNSYFKISNEGSSGPSDVFN